MRNSTPTNTFVSRFAEPVLLLLLLAQPVMAQAQDADAVPNCEVPAYEGPLFEDVYAQAKAVSNELCRAFRARLASGTTDNPALERVLTDFITSSKQALDERGLPGAAAYEAEFSKAERRLSLIDLGDPDLPNFVVAPPVDNLGWTGRFQSQYEGYSPFEISNEAFCTTLDETAPSCVDVFRDFGDAFNNYRSAYDRLFDGNAGLLDDLGSDWDEFLEASKAQTALEVTATTWLHREHFQQNHLVGPPPSQVILLHPDVVYHQIDSDTKGSTAEFGMAVQWVGINWWDKAVPFGVSLASVYVDHDGARDVGHGLQLHFDNRYSIGWARHGDKDAFYFNIDVMKFFETREDKFGKYLGKYF